MLHNQSDTCNPAHVLIDDTVCMVKLIRLNTASATIQMGQYYMDLLHSR